MTGTLSVLHATLATHSRGPAMSVRELEAFRAVLRERMSDILIALAVLALAGLIS